jgi:hypothetical protein
MIVSAIADPSIFGPVSVTDELTSREVLGLLRGILQNGVLLCDPSRQLLRDAMAEADTLSKQPGGTQRGQRISLILQEIYKQHKKYIVSCEEAKWNAANPTTATEQIVVLHAHLQADVVIAPDAMHATLTRDLESKPVEIVAPQDISVSRYESLRIRIAAPEKPLDEMTLAEVEEHFGRAVKYCCMLRIYDYRMVARPRSTAKYRDGIQFVLAIWAKWCVVGGDSSRTAELYTVGNTQTQDGFLTGEDAKTRLDQDIVAAVKANCSCHSTGHVMDDSSRIFHARGFEAKRRAFTIDPGFDALGVAGPIRRCLLKADVAAEKHFEQCRSLRSV